MAVRRVDDADDTQSASAQAEKRQEYPADDRNQAEYDTAANADDQQDQGLFDMKFGVFVFFQVFIGKKLDNAYQKVGQNGDELAIFIIRLVLAVVLVCIFGQSFFFSHIFLFGRGRWQEIYAERANPVSINY